VPLGVGGGLGLAAGAALAGVSKGDEEGEAAKSGLIKIGAGMGIWTATAVGIETGALAIGATAIVGPIGIAAAVGLMMFGVIEMFGVPKAPATGPAAHAGSVRG
jgi:hypothetical protein